MPGPPFGRQQLAGLNGWGRASRPGPGRGRGSLLFISGLTCHFLVLFVELKGGCFPRLPPDGRDTWPVPVLCLPCLALGSFGGRAPGFGLPRCLLRPLAAPGLRRMASEAPGSGSRPALSVLLVPGHVGFTEEPAGPSAPLKRALEGKPRPGGRVQRRVCAGFLMLSLCLVTAMGHFNYSCLSSFKPRGLRFRGMLPSSLGDKVTGAAGTGLRGWVWGWEPHLFECVGSGGHHSHGSQSLALQPAQIGPR